MSGTRRVRVAVVAFLSLLVLPAASDADETPAPDGYRIVHRDFPATGVEHLRLVRDDGQLVVNVARVAHDAPVRLRAVVSHDRVAGAAPTVERTSDMCRRSGCSVAVNGDYFNMRTGEPLGGVVQDGQFIRSPSGRDEQWQIAADGTVSLGPVMWNGSITAPDGTRIVIGGVNVARPHETAVLYTGSWAPSTGTDDSGTEIVLRVVADGGPAPLGHPLPVELAELRPGNSTIPPWGVVLSANGEMGERLRTMWAALGGGDGSDRLTLDLNAEGAPAQSIGGTPVLLRDGERRQLIGGDFVTGRHPRTVVGRTGDGTLLLVVVDGRQATSVGMSLPEVQVLVEQLGATDALNLDGGGSTTFVSRGIMVNRASEQLVVRGGRYQFVGASGGSDIVVANLERPVANALVVVPG